MKMPSPSPAAAAARPAPVPPAARFRSSTVSERTTVPRRYEGCRRPAGAAVAAARRCPPRARPARGLVVEQQAVAEVECAEDARMPPPWRQPPLPPLPPAPPGAPPPPVAWLSRNTTSLTFESGVEVPKVTV
jgi:hypothetical protein